MTETKLNYALRYAAKGWPVLPLQSITSKGICSCGNPGCKSPGKHPLVRAGVNEASIDPEVITQWFSKYPYANIGVATGEKAGIFALDIDPRHGGDDALDAIIARYGKINDDVLAVTGSGGKHIIFPYPGKTGRSTTNLYPGIDTRGDGGYIVVEPSNHISGNSYFWDAEANPLEGATPSEFPEWLLQKLAEKSQIAATVTPPITVLPVDEIKRIRSALFYVSADDRDKWRTVGMALHSNDSGDQAFGLWCEWSQQSDKFDLKDQRRVWDSFKQGGGVTLATLFSLAKQGGWSRPNASANLKSASVNKPIDKAESNKPSKVQDIGLLKRFVFLKNHNRIFDTITRNELTRDGFDGSYMHLFHEQKPSTYFLKSPATIGNCQCSCRLDG